MEQRQLARILLCVQTFAYFSEGQVCTNEGTYICRPGEWITTYTEMGQWAEVERHQVKTRLKKLEQLGLLTVEHLGSYKRIRLTHYEPAIQTPLQENPVNDNLFVHAGHFYASTNEQKGGEA